MPSSSTSSASGQRVASLNRSRESLLLQEPPPEYSLLPRADETYIDAGAGAPIVRAQPPHIVVNPSDPRSQYSQHYFSNGGAAPHPPPVPPRRTDTSSGPIPVNPRLPPRLNVGYEQIETAPHLTPRPHNHHMHSSYPHSRRDWMGPVVVSGPSAQRNRSYSASRYSPSQVTYNVVCPNCRNTGWVSSRMPCTCPVGNVAINSGSRPYGSSSLLGLLDDILNPNSRFYAPHSDHRGGGGGYYR
ncbi:hypothetical protein GGI22_004611 [Coemansia erecta]|nr:hypothetical protein GGI22_004611 [Coemansia erecta]